MLDALAPARRRFVLAVAGIAVVAVAVAGGVALAHRAPSVSPVAQDAQPPVLLVPGYGGSTTDLAVLAKALEDAGRTTRIVALGARSTGDLHAQARVLDDAVREVRTSTGSRSVDLVGYSAGGVVVRVWMADHRGGDVARRIVTLGSPHHGTAVAALGADLGARVCPTACQQLAPGSELLRSLNARDETAAGPRWVSVWTSQDKTVVPPSSATLSGALDIPVQSICPAARISHQTLPSDPIVVAIVLAELGRSLPEKPGTDVCAKVSR
ncbi:triacylglycerol lipase [Marmoricola sp. URHA0025 HA25]